MKVNGAFAGAPASFVREDTMLDSAKGLRRDMTILLRISDYFEP